MRYRIATVKPLGAALVVLAAAVAFFAFSGCTVYQEPGYYSDGSDEYYDDEPVYDDPAYDSEYAVDFGDLDYWGQWLELAPYGTVWRPTVVIGWEPYTNGQWMWTNLGWTWVSYEPFGWATYHYGWWAWDHVWGWVWLPDYEWHPSRVDWLYYDGYIAWAPLPPPDFPIFDPWTPGDCDPWRVVRAEDLTDDHVDRRIIRFKDRKRPGNRTTVIYHEPDPSQVHTGLHSLKPIEVGLVPDSADPRIQRIKLPSDEAKPIDAFRKRTEDELREEQKRVPRRPVERPREPRVFQDNDKPTRGDDTEKVDHRPPPQRDESDKRPPEKTERPAQEKPKQEPEKKPEKKPETKPEKRPDRQPEKKPEKQPEKKPPQREKPGKEEPRKEKPKKEEPKKEEPKKETPAKEKGKK